VNTEASGRASRPTGPRDGPRARGIHQETSVSQKQKYEVLTWDFDKRDWTPQKGIRRGPYTLFGLRKAIRKLREMGYGYRRCDMFCALIQQR
jgi:hypothetical protein